MSSTLSQLKKKQEQLAARIQSLEAAEKTRERKKDVRRKILLGALVLERLGQGDPRAQSLKAELDGYLTRDHDRALFELSPLPKKESAKTTEKALAETG
jgi:hypothetical protein